MGAADHAVTITYWRPLVPDVVAWTLCPEGALAVGGHPATFISSTHAWIAFRIMYLADIGTADVKVEDRARRYRAAFDAYQRFCSTMCEIAELAVSGDVHAAAQAWDVIDQPAADEACTTVLCEREPHRPRGSLATLAARHFRIGCHAPTGDVRWKRTDAVNALAWANTADGACQSCGTETISPAAYRKLRSLMRANPTVFNLEPTYPHSKHGRPLPVWDRVTKCAKGVADHVVAWSAGGSNDSTNLVNVCAACNYSRNNASLDQSGVAAFSPGRS